MSNNFPPQSTYQREIEMTLVILNGITDGRDALYVSAPITSGRRFIEWHKQRGKNVNTAPATSQDGFQSEVVDANRAHAKSIMRELRQACLGVLIDPTAVADIPGWSQDDYRHLWARVIEEYAKTVICTDGWEYSNGCAYEFLVAWRKGIRTLTEQQQPLTLGEGRALIQSAIVEMRAESLPTVFLENVVEELGKLNAAEEL